MDAFIIKLSIILSEIINIKKIAEINVNEPIIQIAVWPSVDRLGKSTTLALDAQANKKTAVTARIEPQETLIKSWEPNIAIQPPIIEIKIPITNSLFRILLSKITSKTTETAGNTAIIIVIVTGSEKIWPYNKRILPQPKPNPPTNIPHFQFAFNKASKLSK